MKKADESSPDSPPPYIANAFVEDNTSVLPGDVLLLRSRGWIALGNRSAQRALRLTRPLQTAKYTHVALVISPTHIVDAMPDQGVTIRSWKNAAERYDLGACMVARHPAMSAGPQSQQALFERARFYYQQPYKLTSLMTRRVRHERGLVCSQFVALVLEDLGLPPVVRSAMQGLPSDIDHNTRNKNGWRQFPLSESGLFQRLGRGAAGAAGHPVAQDGADRHTASAGAWPFTDAALGLSEAIGERFAASMAQFGEDSRAIAQLDRLILGQTDLMSKLRDEAGEKDAGLPSQVHGGYAGDLSAADLLERWHILFVDDVSWTARVLADADVRDRIDRHRALLGAQIEGLTRIVATAIEQGGAVSSHFNILKERIETGAKVGPEFLVLLYQEGLDILRPMAWLREEAKETIFERRTGYGEQLKAVLAVPGLEDDVKRQACDQLLALAKLDAKCLDWMTGPGFFLPHAIQVVARILAGAEEAI